MENKSKPDIPYFAFEIAQASMERQAKRLIIALVIAVVLIFASNAAWLWAWMQYDYTSESTTTETITVDGKDGAANYASNGGRIINGTNNSQAEDPDHPNALSNEYARNP